MTNLFQRRWSVAWTGAVALVALFLSVTAVRAQEQPDEPAHPPRVTVDEIKAEIADLEAAEAAETLSEEDTMRLQLYRAALAALPQAEQARQLEVEVDDQLAAIPVGLEALRAELAQPPTEPKPEVEPDATLADLEAALGTAKSELETFRARLVEIEAELKGRETRQATLRDQIATLQQSLEGITAQEAALPLPDESPALTRARRARLRADRQALDAELAVARKELQLFDAMTELLPLQRDRLVRRVNGLVGLEAAWQTLVDDARAEESRRQREEAARAAAEAHPVVTPIAEANVRLARRRAELQPAMEQAQTELARFHPDPEVMLRHFERLKLKVDTVGLTNKVGRFLRKSRDILPDTSALRARIAARRAEMAELEFEYLDAEDDREALITGSEATIRELLVPLDVSATERTAIETEIRERLQVQREYLDGLANDLTTYFDRLDALNRKEQLVVKLTAEVTAYIDEHILWMQSAEPLGLSDFQGVLPALRWLTDPEEWAALGRAVWQETPNHWPWVFMLVVTLAALLAFRPRMRSRIRTIASTVASPKEGTLGQFVEIALYTLLLAAFWPMVLWALGAWLLLANQGLDIGMGESVAEALQRVAQFLFVVMLAYETCRPQGLGETQFEWSPRTTRIVRREIRWLLVFVFVLALPSSIVNQQEAFESSLGRLCTIASTVVLAVFVYRLLNPRSGILRDQLTRMRSGWASRLRYIWFPLAVLTPAALGVISGLGYHYTAILIGREVMGTAKLVVLVTLAYYFARRWVQIGQRKLAVEQARKRRAAAEERAARGDDRFAMPEDNLDEVDIASVSAQAMQLLRTGVLFALLIGSFVIWAESMPAIGFLDRIELWEGATVISTVEGDASTAEAKPIYAMVTVQDLLWAGFLILLTLLVAKNIPGLLGVTVLQHLPLERGSQFAIATIVRYTITIVGMVVAFRYIGISWAKVQWLAAALTVGLGFGLNEIFGNFISGLIILFERPIRVGDTVTVANITGTVTEIKIRATTIRDWDRKELVIPNKTFVMETITNWTLTDPILRLVFPVTVDHDSDTAAAEECLLKAARGHEHVLEDPAPTVMFTEVGEQGLRMDLRVYIPHMDHFRAVKHDVFNAIVANFRQANIRLFSFSRRDVQVRSAQDDAPLQLSDSQELGAAGA